MILPLQNKPRPTALLTPTAPLAEGLLCASLMNEPGRVSRNIAGTGLLVGTSAAGGLSTSVTAAHESWYNDLGSGYTFCLWHSGIALGSWGVLLSISDSTLAWQRYSSSGYFKNYHNGNGVTMSNFLLSEVANPGFLACLWSGNAFQAYVDGEQIGNAAMYTAPKVNSATSTLTLGGSYTVYQFLMYDRPLSETEIRRLYRDPFAVCGRSGVWPPATITGGSTQSLAGSIAAMASLSGTATFAHATSGTTNTVASLAATLQSRRTIFGSCPAQSTMSATLSQVGEVTLSGTVAGVSMVSTSLTVSNTVAVTSDGRDWRAGALFHGMTPSAHKLGTVLTGGWFWMRRDGCSAAYRGATPGEVNFDNILSVTEGDSAVISLPAHIPHGANSSYCYVVRRFNSKGDLEQTDSAAVAVRTDGNGNLAPGLSNAVFGLRADAVDGRRIRLTWSYSPLDQEAPPVLFRIYWDAGAGQVNLAEAVAEIAYRGRTYYSYRSEPLNDGTYTFLVRARTAELVEDMSLQAVRCSIHTRSPDALTILTAEAIP